MGLCGKTIPNARARVTCCGELAKAHWINRGRTKLRGVGVHRPIPYDLWVSECLDSVVNVKLFVRVQWSVSKGTVRVHPTRFFGCLGKDQTTRVGTYTLQFTTPSCLLKKP